MLRECHPPYHLSALSLRKAYSTAITVYAVRFIYCTPQRVVWQSTPLPLRFLVSNLYQWYVYQRDAGRGHAVL